MEFDTICNAIKAP